MRRGVLCALLLLALAAQAEEDVLVERVEGRIVDDRGEPVGGASVALHAFMGVHRSRDYFLYRRRDEPTDDEIARAIEGLPPGLRFTALRGWGYNARFELLATAVTSSDGRFSLPVTRPLGKLYRDCADLAVCASTTSAPRLAGGEALLLRDASRKVFAFDHDIQLAPCRELTVVVRADGAPIASQTVEVRQTLAVDHGGGLRSVERLAGGWRVERPRPTDWILGKEHLTLLPVTDRNGRIAVPVLSGGDSGHMAWVRVRRPGFATFFEDVPLEGSAALLVDLETDAHVHGVVHGPDKQPIPRARIRGYAELPGGFLVEVSETHADERGVFDLGGLRAKTSYQLLVDTEDGSHVSETVKTEPRDELEVTLGIAARLSLELRGDGGGELWVSLRRQKPPRDADAFADAKHRSWAGKLPLLELGGLEPGTRRLIYFARDWAPAAVKKVDLVAGQTTTLAIDLRKPRTVTGHVRNRAGEPLAATVHVYLPEYYLSWEHRTKEGAFSFDDLPWTDVQFSVSADGYEDKEVEVADEAGECDVVLDAKK